MRYIYPVLFSAVVLNVSCKADERQRVTKVEARVQARAPAPTSVEATPPSRDSLDFVVRPTGAGSLRIGMSLADLAPYLRPGTDTVNIGGGCETVTVVGAPDSVDFMVEGRQVVRVDVFGGPTDTAEGARVGDTEQQILSVYPTAQRQPHKYTNGSYLIVIPGAPSGTLHRYVFETDGRRVTTYRAGVYPPVEYVEGCA
jgi:hypothetical protein